MRISDWSSDVCSSDLSAAGLGEPIAVITIGTRYSAISARSSAIRTFELWVTKLTAQGIGPAVSPFAARASWIVPSQTSSSAVVRQFGVGKLQTIERKSVVKGKSVAVSFIFGGRLFI